MALGRKRKEVDESQIDLTPMLDVVFIMLIFFIVTASFVNEVGLSVDRPPTTDQPPLIRRIEILCSGFLRAMNCVLRAGVLTSELSERTWNGCMQRIQKRR